MKIAIIDGHYVVISNSRSDLREVRKALNRIIALYGCANIDDLYDLCGIRAESTKVTRNTGWVASRANSYVFQYDPNNSEYSLTLPRAIQLAFDVPEFKEALPKASKDAKIQKAYNALTKAYCKESTVEDLYTAMEEAIGYLGEVLE